MRFLICYYFAFITQNRIRILILLSADYLFLILRCKFVDLLRVLLLPHLTNRGAFSIVDDTG